MPHTHRISTTLALPAHFRSADVLAFHQRDAQMIAERVIGQSIHKGLYWGQHPACLSMQLTDQQAEISLAIDTDTPPCSHDLTTLTGLATRMLGLNQNIRLFEQHYQHHPQLGKLIRQTPGLRVPVAANPYEAITWGIIGQQISVNAAVAIRRRFVQLLGELHSSGLYCYPAPERVLESSPTALQGIGFSGTKAKATISISQAIVAGKLALHGVNAAPAAEQLYAQLLTVHGIGPWTANYALLRGFGWLDGSLHGDVVVRNSLQHLLDRPDKLSQAFTRDWLAQFSPWRALVAAHLWATQSNAGY